MDRLERAINRVVDRMVAVYERELQHEAEAYKLDQAMMRAEYRDGAQTEEGMMGFGQKYGQAELDKQIKLSLKRVQAQLRRQE